MSKFKEAFFQEADHTCVVLVGFREQGCSSLKCCRGVVLDSRLEVVGHTAGYIGKRGRGGGTVRAGCSCAFSLFNFTRQTLTFPSRIWLSRLLSTCTEVLCAANILLPRFL